MRKLFVNSSRIMTACIFKPNELFIRLILSLFSEQGMFAVSQQMLVNFSQYYLFEWGGI